MSITAKLRFLDLEFVTVQVVQEKQICLAWSWLYFACFSLAAHLLSRSLKPFFDYIPRGCVLIAVWSQYPLGNIAKSIKISSMSLSCLSQAAVLQQLEGCCVASKPWRHLWRNRTSSRRLRPTICGSIQAEIFWTQGFKDLVWKLIWNYQYHRAGRTSRTSWSWNRRVQIAAPPEAPRSVDVDMLMLRWSRHDR